MPTYEYECQECGAKTDFNCGVNTVFAIECKKCGGRAKRIYTPPVIIQKGYKETDARYNRGRG
jgi:putative FmdB family regulatory protein